MVRRHYHLPSLNALAAFEAAARHLSLTRAAAELNVTPGAVSKQVKALEDELGCALFLRLHRALALTPAGDTVHRALMEAFEKIAQSLKTVSSEGAVRSVSIGSTMAFAHLWLMPRLGGFWNAHPEIVVDHMISDRAQELVRSDVDLIVRYGDGQWPDADSAKLFDDSIIAVASPGFAAKHPCRQPAELAGLPLLSLEGVDWNWTTWPDFLATFAVPRKRLNIRRFNSYVISIQAAQDGQGVALGWLSLVKPLIARRKLVQVTAARLAAPQSFYVTWSSRRPLSPEAKVLREWLQTAAN